jgi:hypothetical protein
MMPDRKCGFLIKIGDDLGRADDLLGGSLNVRQLPCLQSRFELCPFGRGGADLIKQELE